MKKYKLGDLIEVTRGASLSGNYYASSGKYIRLTCGHFDYCNNCFKENTSKDNLYYTGEFRADFLLEKGDLITPLTEQAIGLLGSTAWIPESGKYIQSQDIAKIRCNEELLDKQFAYYLISSNIVKQQLSAAAQQTKIRHTSPDKIKDCTVWLPSLAEQKQIGLLLFDIDRKIALNRSINHNLEAMVKQLYDYWFVQFDFPDENGKPYKSSGGKMVWNEKLKREVPEGWEVASLNRELEIKSGYAFKSESYSSEGIFKIVTIKNVQDGYLDISTCECIETLPKDIKKWCILQKGDRLISLTGNCGRVCRVTSEALLLNQRVGVFCSNELFSEYFFQFLASDEGHRYCVNLANGAAQANLSPIDLCKMELIYPSRETLSLFNKIVQPIIQRYIANEQKIENLTKLRDSLLPLLMNGQVTVNYDLSND